MGKSKTQGDVRAKKLLDWYDSSRRDLPWRAASGAKSDVYAVWLSEIMLQQTSVVTVAAYYRKFMALWPRVENLAAAPVEQVMQAWAGLGYYSRARNLHACAQKIVADFGGVFPTDEAQLRGLPGIGPYTAAAIVAIAHGRRAIVVDGNIERYAARLLALETPLPAAKKAIYAFVESLTPQDRAGDFAQAGMDFGATLCTPRNPDCGHCPLHGDCAGAACGHPEDFPRKALKKPRPLRRGATFYLRRADGALLTRTRPPRGLLGGMVEFCCADWRAERSPDWALRQFAQGALKGAPMPGVAWRHAGEVDHIFTHFALNLTVFVGAAPRSTPAPEGFVWLDESRMRAAALPSVMRKVEACARAHLAASGLSGARIRS
ncbi:A/G-specific adenine glycosylase [uncultured Rhodoblastus sp.]|uniref:A/G-specific adenine glycosylase n=1 Tax=uncultured Rhodoblastus sp. TaxID=543037 RepID=UPI0025DE0189|nr:A/G-specific adenine glycosylase [uncultured Rhodoblastus sp.]